MSGPLSDRSDRAIWTALDVPAFAAGQPVLLAAKINDDGIVRVFTPQEACELHAEGLLTGWRPLGGSSR